MSDSQAFGPPILLPPPAPPQGPALPVYIDLYAIPSFRIRQDAGNGRIFVQGFVGNRGNMSANRSVTVAVGVTTYYYDAFRRTDERRTVMGSGLRPGDTALTEPTVAPLRFRPDGYTYLLEIIIDIFHELSDVSRANNHYAYSYWAYPIGLRTEEGGKFTLTVKDRDKGQESGAEAEIG